MLGLAILASVIALGDPASAWRLMSSVGWQTDALVAVLTIPYLMGRGLQWRSLLSLEGVRIGWRPFLLALASGEFSKDLPGGVYVEDYLLTKFGVSAYKSIIATTAVSGLEVMIAIPLVLLWGVPGWGWLPLTILCVLGGYLLVIAVLWLITRQRGQDVSIRKPGWLLTLLNSVRTFFVDALPLVSLRTLRAALLPTGLYLLVASVDILLLGSAVHIPGMSLRVALVVYAIAILAMDLIPLPTDVGVTEAGGAGALLAFGATKPEAVATFLLLRVLLTGATMILTGLILLVLRFLSPRPPALVAVAPSAANDSSCAVEPPPTEAKVW